MDPDFSRTLDGREALPALLDEPLLEKSVQVE